jgi:hypothetical protein
MPEVIDRLRVELRKYEATCMWWQAVTRTAEEERRAESYDECVRYSQRLEDHAHSFGALVAELVAEVGGRAPAVTRIDPMARLIRATTDPTYYSAYETEPLGGPVPGVDGAHLPDHHA